MHIKTLAILVLLTISSLAACQINQTDQLGKKQGVWIKKYPGGNVQYEGTFKDDHPVGEFKRYYENHTLKSVMIYSDDGRTADATLYHPNGFMSSQGKYIDQMKEGKWKFYSEITDSCLVSEEEYIKNIPNGVSVTYYPVGKVAERLRYINGKKDGEWLKYYESGKISLRSYYTNGILNGKLEVWFENGRSEYSGFYKNNLREGKWVIFREDGSVRYEINYNEGIASDRQMEKDAEEFIDMLEKNKDKVVDPEKTGEIR
jgi:antitoxin component YwqK of YwqJK toxin-antitoxin module